MAVYDLKSVSNPQRAQQMIRNNSQKDLFVVGGIPGIKLSDSGVVSGMKMKAELIKNGTLNPESLPVDSKNLSIECLGSLCISVEKDTDPTYSFLTDTNKNVLGRKTKEKTKNDGSKMFPETNDPWHEHDESATIGEKQLLDAQKQISNNIKPQALLDTIYKVNIKSQKIGDTVKLPQLRNIGDK